MSPLKMFALIALLVLVVLSKAVAILVIAIPVIILILAGKAIGLAIGSAFEIISAPLTIGKYFKSRAKYYEENSRVV